MLQRKWKNTIILSIALFVMAAIITAFYFIILYTPNMNSYIYLKADNVLGSVTINVKNADNGAPYSYFTYEHTSKGEHTHEFVNKNLLFKGDEEEITIEFVIANMGHYKTNLKLDISGPGSNAKMQILIDNVKTELFENYVLEPNQTKTISFVVGKEDVKKPIRSKFTIEFEITRLESGASVNPESGEEGSTQTPEGSENSGETE